MKKNRSSPQISGVMVLHHNMVSPQNGVIQGPATPLVKRLINKNVA